ncbi:ECF-type sigma factor [Dokdonella sp.]|uniref:ECF-type sigma factor n=1 Tax=Dokdonella sp. TaxID=2291710 RepID=UPI00378504E8
MSVLIARLPPAPRDGDAAGAACDTRGTASELRVGAIVDTSTAADQLVERLSAEGFGDSADLRALLPSIYADLKRVAHRQLFRHLHGPTLSTTVLVHEAYSRLVQGHDARRLSRTHFFALSARVMRQVMIDHARARATGKRGGTLLGLHETDAAEVSPFQALLAFAQDLAALDRADPHLARLIEQHWFLGMDSGELAALHGTTQRTIQRDLRRARAWIGELLAP